MTRPADHVRTYQYLASRLGSGLEVFEMSRDGSGRVMIFFNPAGRDGLPLIDLTNEKPCLFFGWDHIGHIRYPIHDLVLAGQVDRSTINVTRMVCTI